MTNYCFDCELAKIEEEMKKAGIPNRIPKNLGEMLEDIEKLEKAGIIKRKGYNLTPPFERHYFPTQEPQQPYFSM